MKHFKTFVTLFTMASVSTCAIGAPAAAAYYGLYSIDYTSDAYN